MIFSKEKIHSSLEGVKQSLKAKFGSESVQIIEISKLKFDTNFKTLFEQEADKVERIAEDMRLHGFDRSQPVIVTKNLTVLDGHSRLLACRKSGITRVPTVIKEFTDKDSALQYELHLQLDRRNLTDAETFAIFTRLEKMKAEAKETGNGQDDLTDGKLAELLKKSERQVQKMREVARKADAETLRKISDGKMTVNQAYGRIKAGKKPKAPAKTAVRADRSEFYRGALYALEKIEQGKTAEEIREELKERR